MKILIFNNYMYYFEFFQPYNSYGKNPLYLYINSYFLETCNTGIHSYLVKYFEYSIVFFRYKKSTKNIKDLFLKLKSEYNTFKFIPFYYKKQNENTYL
jgi:hypothetical protein